MSKIKTYISKTCGCEIPVAKKYINKEKYICSVCGGESCAKHNFNYVDGNNIAITRNSPNICVKCLNTGKYIIKLPEIHIPEECIRSVFYPWAK
jgi:hypothetical protein